MNVLTIEQMKKAEQMAVELGSSYEELMENAGTACAFNIIIKNNVLNKRCVILCGNGNNAGDGFVIARRLDEKAASVSVILVNSLPKTETAKKMFAKIQNTDIEIIDARENAQLASFRISQSDYLVDCMFGTGFRGELDPSVIEMVRYANKSSAIKYAVDIPSGLNGDTGLGEIYFDADITFALGAYKSVHALEESVGKCGNIWLLDIGIPKEVFANLNVSITKITKETVTGILKKRNPESHKGDYGKLLNIVGSLGMGGAAIMSTKSALRTGAGLVTLATVKDIVTSAFTSVLEAVSMPLKATTEGTISFENYAVLKDRMDKSTACLIGCGLSTEDEVSALVKTLIKESTTPIILDADGINILASDINILKTVKCNIILTPHVGEMSRLSGMSIEEIQSDRVHACVSFAKEYNVTVVLKGKGTLIATPDGRVYKNTTGNPGMARGGSGDVLAGIIASFVAQGIELTKAAMLGVYLHGLAGDVCAKKYSEYGMLPTDIIDELPLLLSDFIID